MSLSAPARGEVFQTQTCVHIRWLFLLYPAVLVLLAIIFFAVMVFETRRREISRHDWKSSPLALLFHGLDRQSMGNGEYASITQANEMARIADHTPILHPPKTISVQYCVNDFQRRLVGMGPFDGMVGKGLKPLTAQKQKVHSQTIKHGPNTTSKHRSQPAQSTSKPSPPLSNGQKSIQHSRHGMERRWPRIRFLYNQRAHQILRIVGLNTLGQVRSVIEESSTTFVDYSQKEYYHEIRDSNEMISGLVNEMITRGEWNVRSVESVDEEKRQIWLKAFGAVEGQDPYYAQLARVNFDGSDFTLLTSGDGTHTWTWSPDRKYLIDTWSRVDDDTVDLEVKERRRLGLPEQVLRIKGWNEMDGSGVKRKEQRDGNGNDTSEPKGKHTSTASSVAPSAQSDCDTALRVRHDHRLKVDSRDTSYDTGVLHKINKTEKALEESVVDEDDWDMVTLI
ncbi:hypothetical protein EPUS_08973 [Endocarpon pusillum Z07020]|uniref:Dipeptidylpeptidase IV N-terminal domain-containing protein n=1 Tax=Endocarpon pusillum (strain Z07020 / HMAS-L-300199) TaxID=1263415 RepID=U1GU55_ENDPU|nr:uncharacterized protein EPUS_08973 [Endocarpon pusillum Z07020]ERF75561.1 hypothetical protein EPUS_08973 [Endocarpon pusillum Z07020]